MVKTMKNKERYGSKKMLRLRGVGVMKCRKKPDDNEYYVKTLEGHMKVSDGDYIIKGVQGEYYPCKLDIFEQTYEAVK